MPAGKSATERIAFVVVFSQSFNVLPEMSVMEIVENGLIGLILRKSEAGLG